MIPTAVRASKASRAPLTPKRGNKDYYKGTRQAFLPGGRRTGAPGKHVVNGAAKYRLLDEKVRVFVAPPVKDIRESELLPYVHLGVKLTQAHKRAVWGKVSGMVRPSQMLTLARQHAFANALPNIAHVPAPPSKSKAKSTTDTDDTTPRPKHPPPYNTSALPSWLRSRLILMGRDDPVKKIRRDQPKSNPELVVKRMRVANTLKIEAPKSA